MSNPPPPSIPGGTPPPPSIPTPPAAPAAPSVPNAPAAPAAPAAPPAAAAPTIPLRPAGLGGGIKLGGGLKTVALGSATTPVAPPAGAAAPTVPLTPPGAGMATAQLPQATIGLNTAPAAAPVSSASFTAKKFEEDTEAAPNTLLNVLSFVALAFALIFVGYQYSTDTLEARSMTGWLGGDSKPAAALPPPPVKKRPTTLPLNLLPMTPLPTLLPRSLPRAPMQKNK